MGIRHKGMKPGDGPAPGAYNPEMHSIKPRDGVAKFGTGKRGADPKSDGPAPGAYNIEEKRGGGITMGGRPQDKIRADGPGPGAYNGGIDAVR